MTREEFVEQLRDALNHLYDPERLRGNPLSGVFGVAGRFDTAAALQQILIAAITSLKPPPGEPPQSPTWQVYEPLFYRYVEQLSAEEVADQLGIGARHLRRWQSTAIEALADLLYRQFRLTDEAQTLHPPAANIPDGQMLRQELISLKEATTTNATDLGEALPPVLDLIGKLAARHAVALDVHIADPLPRVGLPPVVLRQTLISLFSVVAPRAASGRVMISFAAAGWDVLVRVQCPQYAPGPRSQLDNEAENLDISRQLAEVYNCELRLVTDARGFDATLVLPGLEQIPVLAIDDKADTLQLLQRYTAGTRYRLTGASDPERALDLVATIAPQVIVLDVMMPHVDGWELLGRLREHPTAREIPIVVCTILAQHDLALLLGANDFLRKPFSRPDFLALLDRLVMLKGSEPHSEHLHTRPDHA